MSAVDDPASFVNYGSSSKLATQAVGSRLAYHISGSGPATLLLHGFPTWSWDWHAVTPQLLQGRCLLSPDFLGYGFSDKPVKEYSIAEQVDLVQALLAELEIESVSIVAHDYGTIVLQEILRRRQSGTCPFAVERVALLNGGIMYEAYQPTALQVALRLPVIGHILASLISKETTRSRLSALLGADHQLDNTEFEGLWHGISANEGQRLSRRLLRYNDERKVKHVEWEEALVAFEGPLLLVWGLDDPVSGSKVLDLAKARLTKAEVVELKGVGHYPQIEVPDKVSEALDRFLPRGS